MPSAIVLGGGIAGLSAAIALHGAGYRVSVHEQAPAIEPLGAAISLWPNAVAALRRLGALDRVEAEAAPITAMLLATRDGQPLLGPWPVGAALHGERAYLPTRALLQKALRGALDDAVPVRLGQRVTAVTDEGEGVRVAFDDGSAGEADLVIAADGLWSAVGDALLGNAARPAGYGGMLALSDPVDGPPLDGLAAEYWGRDERFGVFEVGGGRRYWFYLLTTPHEPLTRDALLARAAGWPSEVAAAIRATPAERLIPVTIAARSAPRRLGVGRVVVTGDAAHGMEPNLGQGACQALEDAVALGAIATRLPATQVADAFTRARLARVTGIMRGARDGGLAVHGARPVQAVLRTGLRLVPGALHRRVVDGHYRMPAY